MEDAKSDIRAAWPDILIEGAPGPRPARTVYAIGRNYAEHAAELGNAVPTEPVVFLKSAAALRPLAAGPLAFDSESFHHEAEIVLVVGRYVPLGESPGWDAVVALALGLDLTRREVQNKLKAQGLPWTAAKSFAGAAVLTPALPRSRFATLEHVEFRLNVNGTTRQSGDTRQMIFSVPRVLEHLARAHPLFPGDLVYTGTPPGVGPVKRGDQLELSFTQLGVSWQGTL